MTCVKLPPPFAGIVCFQPQYSITDKNGRVWQFEFHEFCGPTLLTKKGELYKRMPGEKCPFWDVLTAWIQGGQKTEERDGAMWAVWA